MSVVEVDLNYPVLSMPLLLKHMAVNFAAARGIFFF